MTTSHQRTRTNGKAASERGQFDAPAITEPRVHQGADEFFPAHTVRQTPIALPVAARHQSVELLNQLLVDSIYYYFVSRVGRAGADARR